MSIIDKKRELYGEIAAFRTSCEGFPKFNLSNSFESIDNCSNSLDFLLDLLKATIGFDALKSLTANIMTFELDKIEIEIKKVLKKELKKMVSCGVNPSIPDFFKHQNIIPSSTGVNLDLRKIDYMGIMLVNPASNAGLLTYSDISGGINSQDFHTYLFNTVQLDGTQTNWGSQVFGPPNDILSIEFNSSGPPNNILNVKASEYYSNPANNKKLTDLNNDYIDSISLFGTGVMLNSIIDSLFGSVSFELKKSKEQIKKEVEIEDILECILNADETELIDDSFFTFSNESIRIHEEEADNRSKGIKVLATCNNVESSVPIGLLTGVTLNIKTATTATEKAQAVSNALDEISSATSEEVSDKNKVTAELNFINDAIKKLMIKMGNIILSPKVITIFAVNHYIIYGTNLENPIEWMKKNRILLQAIMNAIRDTIIKILLEVAIKEIKRMIACVGVKVATDYAKSQSAQLASLVGIPQDILRLIQGLG